MTRPFTLQVQIREQFTEANYNLIAYYKTGAWLEWLESELGRKMTDKAIQQYFNRWQFKHPRPADLKKVLEETTGKNLDSAFQLLDARGILPGQERKSAAPDK